MIPENRQRVALYSAYRQRVGDTGSVAAAKLSVAARHAKRAWLEPCNIVNRSRPRLTSCLLKKQARLSSGVQSICDAEKVYGRHR